MAGKSSRTLLLITFLVLGIFADPYENQELRCQCIQTHSDFISLKYIKRVQLIPEGVSCSKKEVIVTLKDGTLICLDPEAAWVMTIIEKILNSAN